MTLSETRELVLRGQNGYCYGSGCLEQAIELHHRIPNTKTNNVLFPHFLNSPFNLVGLCPNCHSNKYHQFDITHDMALSYEQWLKIETPPQRSTAMPEQKRRKK